MTDVKPWTAEEHIKSVLADPDPLVNRLRGTYTNAAGPRQFPVPPIQLAAAATISVLESQLDAHREALRKLMEYCHDREHPNSVESVVGVRRKVVLDDPICAAAIEKAKAGK